MRQRVEAAVDQLLAPYFRTLGIVGWTHDGEPVVDEKAGAMEVGRSHTGREFLTDIPNLGARIAAAEKLLDRVYGRPKQTQEIAGMDAGPLVPPPLPSEPEWAANVRRALEELPLVAADTHSDGRRI
jgi:hypothetical protein